MTRFLEEQQRREETSRALLEQRLAHFRNECEEAKTQVAMSFISIRQELQGREARFEQFRDLDTQHKSRVDSLQNEQANMGVRLTQLSQENDQYSNDMSHSFARFHDAHADLKKMLKTLARKVENLQSGTHPGLSQPEGSWKEKRNAPH